MREIKFRAWDKESKKFIDWDINFMNNPFGTWQMTVFKNDLYIFQQYTGLKDRNGKEIYEGDILKVPDLYELPENTSMTYHNEIIHFKNFTFTLGADPLGEDYEYVSEECEVIGNIYENPELLEVSG